MLTVQRFIDSIEDLSADNRAVLQKHVQSREFGTSLDADCDELFKEALQKDPPATFNALERTAVRRALKHPGKHSTEGCTVPMQAFCIVFTLAALLFKSYCIQCLQAEDSRFCMSELSVQGAYVCSTCCFPNALLRKHAFAICSGPHNIWCMALLIVAGPSDLQAKIDYIYDVTKRQEAQDQTAKAASSSATAPKRKRVESVCGVQIVPCLPPVFEQPKRQRIQQQLSQYPSASINKFAWTGDEDTPEELERLRLRLQALTVWDDFPSNLKFCTQMLFDVHIKHESNQVEITGEQQPCTCLVS